MIYLDNNATTRPNKNMLGAVTNEVHCHFGNPSSSHQAGQVSKALMEEARENVAKALGAKASEIIFTSGGTEANNIALSNPHHTIGSSIEHASVFNCLNQTISVSPSGQLDFEKLERAIGSTYSGSALKAPTVVTVMYANNETGALLDPDNKLFDLKERYDFLLHVDAVQAFGKAPINVSETPIDMLSISAHKCHGLKGAGALYVNSKIDDRGNPGPTKLFKGGPHERGFRPGTENQIGILSLGYMADKITNDSFYKERIRGMEAHRDKFERLLSDVSERNGSNRLSNTSNLYFPSLPNDEDSLELFIELLSEAGVCASGKSACSSGQPTPSRVLQMMFGESSDKQHKSIRFSLSVETTDSEITKAAEIIRSCLTNVGDLHGKE